MFIHKTVIVFDFSEALPSRLEKSGLDADGKVRFDPGFKLRPEISPPVKRQETPFEDVMPLSIPKSVPTLEAFFDVIKKIIAPAPEKPETEAIVPRGANVACPDA